MKLPKICSSVVLFVAFAAVPAQNPIRWTNVNRFGTGLALSRDGMFLAGSGGLWDVETGYTFAAFGYGIFGAEFAPTSKSFFLTYDEGYRIDSLFHITASFDTSTLDQGFSRMMSSPPQFAPSGRSFYSCNSVNVEERNLELRPLRSLSLGDSSRVLESTKLSPRKDLLAVGYFTGDIALVSTSDFGLLRTLAELRGTRVRCAFGQGGSMLFAANEAGLIYKWDIDGATPGSLVADIGRPANVEVPQYWLPPLAVSPSGSLVATKDHLGNILILDPAGNLLRSRQMPNPGLYNELLFGSDDLLYVADLNGVYSLNTSDLSIGRWYTQRSLVNSLDWNPMKPEILLANGSGVTILDPATGVTTETLRVGGTFRKAKFSNSGALVAIDNLSIELLDRASNESLSLGTGGATSNDIRFSKDDSKVASAGNDGYVRVWSRSGNLLAKLAGSGAPIVGVDFHPGGKFLAVAPKDASIIVYRTVDWTKRPALVLDSPATGARFTLDGKYLLVTHGSSMSVYATATWQLVSKTSFAQGQTISEVAPLPDNLTALVRISTLYGASGRYVSILGGNPNGFDLGFSSPKVFAISRGGDSVAVGGAYWGDVIAAVGNFTRCSLGQVTLGVNTASGTTNYGLVQLTAPAPPGGAIVKVTTSITAAKAPWSLYIPEGETSAYLPLTLAPVATPRRAMVTVSFNGASRTMTIVLLPAYIDSVTAGASSVRGGRSVQITVRLDSRAPSTGTLVRLASSSPYISVPTSVTIPAGRSMVSFAATASAPPNEVLAQVTATQSTPMSDGSDLQVSREVLLSVKP